MRQKHLNNTTFRFEDCSLPWTNRELERKSSEGKVVFEGILKSILSIYGVFSWLNETVFYFSKF